MKRINFSINTLSLFTIVIASLSGFFFGHYLAIVSGAIEFMSEDFHFTLHMKAEFVGVVVAGALIGSSLGGILTKKWGRKKLFFLTVALLVVGCVWQALGSSFIQLLLARAVQGFSIGLISVFVPLYLSEVCSAQLRGRVVACYQVMMNIGILAAYFVCYLYTPAQDWKLMFLVGLIPVLMQGICAFFLPESPYWLSKVGRHYESLKVLEALEIPPAFSSAEESKPFLKKNSIRLLLFLGLTIAGLQQCTGVNAVICYAPSIFSKAGFDTPMKAILASVILGGFNLVGCLISLWLLDKTGRRRMLLTGLGAMMISLLLLSLCALFSVPYFNKISMTLLFIYIVGFAVGPGPATWVLLSEIFPIDIKDKAMGYALILNWSCFYVVLRTFPYCMENFGIFGTFGIYGLLNLIGFVFVYRSIPETKGKSFDEVIDLFQNKLK